MKVVPNGEVRNGKIYETIYHVETVTPPIPKKEEIDGWDLPTKKQKFVRTTLPKGFKPLEGRDGKHPSDYAPEFQKFIEREWKRRLNGYWFMNNGMVTYIPGGYYFELCWWPIDVGYKEYRDRDRRKWMFWQTAVNSKDCFGVIYMKHRRDGASYWAGCINFEKISRTSNAQGGMQTKTGKDAKKLFKKVVVKPFRKLPTFFVPIISNSDNPTSALEFFEPSNKITKNNSKIRKTAALESFIDWQPTPSESYDGDKLIVYHGDEFGKTTEAKVTETWKIVKECLSTGAGSNIVGKAIITSTVAEGTKKGGNEFKKIWDQSHPAELTKNGRTVSGLWRLFLPADDGLEMHIDEYGMSNRESAKAFILNERAGLEDKNDFEGLAEQRRLYPLTEMDAFTPPPKNRLFDDMKLNKRLEELDYKDAPYIRRGNFVWKNGERDTRVIWEDDKNGKWVTGFLFENPEDSNQYEKRGKFFFPLNANKFCGASDPVDHKNSEGDERRSRFAGTAFRKFDLMQPAGTTNKFVALYLYRPPKPELAYEDMICMCVYYGMDLLPEMQKPGLSRYFENRGYAAFIGKRPEYTYALGKAPKKAEEGINASTGIHIQIVEEWQTYVYDNSELIDFVDIITDLKDFDINDTTKYDVAMCGGYNLIYSKKALKQKQEPTKKATDYFTNYNKR